MVMVGCGVFMIWLARAVSDQPVVHQYVWLPQRGGRYPHILNVPVLGGIPGQVHIHPLLQCQIFQYSAQMGLFLTKLSQTLVVRI